MTAQARLIEPCDTADDSLVGLETARTLGMDLAAHIGPPAVAKMPLSACLDRVLAQDVMAPCPLPPFDTAAVDGYAIRCSDLSGTAPFRLRIARSRRAGDGSYVAPTHEPGIALRIVAGAAIPPHFNSVVPLESAAERGGLIDLAACPRLFANIRRQGATATAGSVLLEAGACISAQDIGLLAATEHAHVPVRRKLKVAVVSSGADSAQTVRVSQDAQMLDASRPMLLAEMSRPWLAIRDLGDAGGDPALLAQILDVSSEDNHVVIVSGRNAEIDEDFLRPAVEQLGGEIVVSRIAMQPGEATLIARLRKTIIIGLPGNPVAACISMQAIVWPILCNAAGRQDDPRCETGIAGFSYAAHAKHKELPLVRVVGRDPNGQPMLDMPATTDLAGYVHLSRSDGYALIGPDMEEIKPGDRIAWSRF